MSHVTFSFLLRQSGEAYQWRVFYQRGLPHLVFVCLLWSLWWKVCYQRGLTRLVNVVTATRVQTRMYWSLLGDTVQPCVWHVWQQIHPGPRLVLWSVMQGLPPQLRAVSPAACNYPIGGREGPQFAPSQSSPFFFYLLPHLFFTVAAFNEIWFFITNLWRLLLCSLKYICLFHIHFIFQKPFEKNTLLNQRHFPLSSLCSVHEGFIKAMILH